MRLVRFGERGSERPGVLDRQGRIRDLSRVVPDLDGSTMSPANLDRLRALDHETLPPVEGPVRFGACIGAVRNIVCIGLNYSDHAAETNTPIPSQPVVFNKHTGALSGPNDPVIVPPGAKKLDWEVELAVVMGRPCWHVFGDERARLHRRILRGERHIRACLPARDGWSMDEGKELLLLCTLWSVAGHHGRSA